MGEIIGGEIWKFENKSDSSGVVVSHGKRKRSDG